MTSEIAPVVRDSHGRIVSGVVNPGGRPKLVVEVQRLARLHTVEAIEALVDVMRMGGEKVASARVAAANALLDRAWGKVGSAVEDGPEEKAGTSPLTVEQVRALAARRLSSEH